MSNTPNVVITCCSIFFGGCYAWVGFIPPMGVLLGLPHDNCADVLFIVQQLKVKMSRLHQVADLQSGLTFAWLSLLWFVKNPVTQCQTMDHYCSHNQNCSQSKLPFTVNLLLWTVKSMWINLSFAGFQSSMFLVSFVPFPKYHPEPTRVKAGGTGGSLLRPGMCRYPAASGGVDWADAFCTGLSQGAVTVMFSLSGCGFAKQLWWNLKSIKIIRISSYFIDLKGCLYSNLAEFICKALVRRERTRQELAKLLRRDRPLVLELKAICFRQVNWCWCLMIFAHSSYFADRNWDNYSEWMMCKSCPGTLVIHLSTSWLTNYWRIGGIIWHYKIWQFHGIQAIFGKPQIETGSYTTDTTSFMVLRSKRSSRNKDGDW